MCDHAMTLQIGRFRLKRMEDAGLLVKMRNLTWFWGTWLRQSPADSEN